MRKNIFTNYFAFVLIAAIILQSFSFGAPLMNNANADEIKENSNIQVEEQNIIPEGKQYIPEQTEQSQAASALGILESQGVPTYSINEQPDRGEATGSQQLLQDGANTSHELLNREPDDSQQLLSKKDEPDESDESVYKKDEPDGSDELLYKLNEPDGSEESLNKQGETNHSEESLHKQTEPNALNQLFNTPTDGGEEITGKQAVTSQLIEISFSQNEYNLVADETFQTVVTAVYSDDSSFEITDKCEFNIDNETIAEIDSNGVILAKNIGQAQLFAVYNGLYCSATLNVNHKDLSVPINLTTENLTEQITVMWESVSEADGYDLLVDEVIQTVSDNVYCHDNLIPDTLHTYKVRAKQEERVSAWSHEVSAWTNKAEVSIVKIEFVSEEYKLMAGESCQSVVNVVYSDDSFFDITSECIFNIEDETIAEINSEGIIQAKDVGQTQVFAVYKDYSCTAAIKIGLQKPQNIRTENKADQITIMWDPVECTGYYELEADEINITVTDTVYLHSNLYPNTQHIYKIRAIKGEHVSDWSNEILALTNLSTPVNLYAEKDEENCTVKLNWDDVQDATGYKVYRNGEEVDNVLTNEFIGSGLEVGVLYEYTVKAYSANNESAQSEPIDVSIGIKDLIISSNFTLTQNIACVNLYLNGGTLDLNGYRLVVAGNAMHAKGIMNIDGGELIVFGDYSLGTSSNDSLATLKMVNESDYVQVAGNFLTQSKIDHTGLLTAGLMEIGGDFSQLYIYNGSGNYTGTHNNFRTSGTHKVVLNGTSKQTVNFYSPTYSNFNILLLTKPFSTGYNFNRIPLWNYLIEGYRAPAHNGRSKGTHPATGNYSRSFTDMTVTALGFDISITRTYNSSDDKNTHFGRGWSFGYEGSVQNYEDSSIYKKVTLPNGSVQTFTKNEDGTFTAYDTRNTLVKLSDDSYILAMKDQTSYGFNASGYLVWMKDRYGNIVNITVDDYGKVQKIKDATDREYNITYENDSIKSITDPKGRSVIYDSENGNLIRVKAPDGNYTRYSYDTEGFLTEIRDHNNNLLESIAYLHEPGENQHKVDYTINAYGNRFTYAYNNLRAETTITDSNNRQTIKRFDSSYSITSSEDAEGRTTINEYYKDGTNINRYWEEKSVTDRNGDKTQYQRDDNGNITKITNPDLSFKEMGYDNKNNMIWEKDETGRLTYYIYDSQCIYLLKKVQPLDGTTEYVDGESNEDDFSITRYTYYTDSECQQLGYKAKGLLKSITDPEGSITTFTYDAYGNVVTVDDPETHNITQYEYNNIGWRQAEVTPEGYRTEYEYDSNGRLIRKILEEGETTRIVYNPMGQIIKEVSPNLYSTSHDDRNNNNYTGDHGTRYTYYSTGDIHTITDAENNTTTYTYDSYGNIKTETKPNGAVYTYDYDEMNRKTKVWFGENAQSSAILLEEYEYRILSDKKTETIQKVYINDSDALTTICTYDYAGRLVTQQNPDGTVQSQQYYPNGSLKSTTDQRQNTTYNTYDGQNRLSEQWTPIENNGGIRYSYKKITYDSAGRQKQILIGKELVSLYSVPSTFAITTFTYYRNGLIKSKTDNEGRKVEYRYDNDGNLATEDIYIDDETFETTEYENNHMGKPVKERKYIRKGDIYENAFNDNGTETINTWFTYDKNGNLKSVTNHKGITTTYGYDNMNRQISVSMPGGDEYGIPVIIRNTSQCNWEGKVTYTEDANGNVTSYEYDKRGFLTHVVNAEGGITAFWYDRAGRVTAEVFPEHFDESKTLTQMNRKEYTNDSMSRVLTETKVNFDEVQNQLISFVSKAFQYDTNGNVTKELDALGYEYGTGSTIQQKINTGYGTEYTYNLNNQLISVLDPVSKQKGLTYTVKYTYDALGRTLTETNAKGHVISYEYDDAGNLLKKEIQSDASSPKQVMETYSYDYLGRLISKTDGNQNTIYFEHNGFNKLKKEIYPGDESIPANIVQYQYDELGNLKFLENSLGAQDIYTYDNLGRQTSHTRQKHGESGRINTSVKYDPNGNVRFETDGNGNTTEKTYDSMSRLETIKTTVSGILQTTTYSYDKTGNLVKETDWRNNSYTNTYDSLNRLIKKRDPHGKIIEKLEYNHNHAQIKSYDALGNLTQYEYDRNNRLIKTIDPELNETTQTYDHFGNVATQTDGRGNTTNFYFDEMNRLEKVVNAKGEETKYTYDLNGNKLTQEDGRGHITTYEYNCANLLVRRIDHGGRTGTPGSYTYDMAKVEIYTYSADGSLLTKTDRNAETTTYTYDCHVRLKSETISGSIVSFTYDNNSNQLTVTDSTGTTVRAYDELNRVTLKTVPNIGTVYYEYDIINGVETGETAEKTIDPKGNITTKVYDRAGRLKAVIDGSLSSGQRTVYEYYDNGSRASVTYPTGIKEEYTYYPDNTFSTLTNKYSDGTVMDVYTYTYDNANNQISKHEVINGVNKGTTSYTYDALNRLLTVTEPTGKVTAYTYDMAGNRVTETITSGSETIKNNYSYNEQNRLEDISTSVNNTVVELTSYTYDNNGNQLETIKTEYVDGIPQTPVATVMNTYDKRNQLIKTITSDDATVTNGYNGEGLRVSKTINDLTTYYLYEYDKVVLEVNDNGAQKARNLYGINLLMRTVDNETYYYIYNGHADVTALIDTAGNISATYYYDAFGNILEQTGDVDNNITYAGYQYDDETGLYYLNARMYDPKIARFLQEDTYRGDPNDPLSLNLYTYCANNPLLYYDPTGHNFVKKTWNNFKEGFNTLFLKSEEDRQEDFNLIYDYGGNDAYTKAITSIGGGLAEAGDFWKDPVAQMEENNQKLIMPFVTDTLGIKEGNGAYNAIKGIVTSVEALSISGVEMIKGTASTGFAIGSFIGNRTLLDINTVGLVTGHVSAEQYKRSLNTVFNDAATIKSMPVAMTTGIKNSVVNLASNGLDFFSYEASLAEKSQLVTDFTTVVGTVEAAHGLYKVTKPYMGALKDRVTSSNLYKTLASERGSIRLGPRGGSQADFYVKPNGDVIPSTGYRYSARNTTVMQNAKSGTIAARADGTYFSFDKFDDAIVAQGKLQIPYRPEYRIGFDTLDIIDDISIPNGKWGTASYLEPITKDFKNFGPGKATQAVTYSEINSVNEISKLR